jgi:hypothetical protein
MDGFVQPMNQRCPESNFPIPEDSEQKQKNLIQFEADGLCGQIPELLWMLCFAVLTAC